MAAGPKEERINLACVSWFVSRCARMETSAEEEQVQLSSDPKYLGLGSTVIGGKVQTGSQQSVISSNHLLAAFIKPYAIHG